MLDRASTHPQFRPRRSLFGILAMTALLCVAPISLVQGQSASGSASIAYASHAPLGPGATKSSVAKRTAKTSAKGKHVVATRPANTNGLSAIHASPKPSQSSLTTVFSLEYAFAQDTASHLQGVFYNSNVIIEPDTRTEQIIVRADKTTTDEIAAVIRKLDQPETVEDNDPKQMRVYHFVYAEANKVAEVFRGSVAARRDVSIALDARTNSLIVIATQDKLQEIDKLARNLDVPNSETEVTRILTLQFTKADEVLKLVRAVSHQPESLQIVADTRTNRIVVHGSEDAINKLQTLVSVFDVPAKG